MIGALAAALLMRGGQSGSETGGSGTDFHTTTSNYSSPQAISAIYIGTPAADRFVVVTIEAYAYSSPNISGVTIGGVSATELFHYDNTGAGGNEHVWFFGAIVPTGTTADVVVTSTGIISAPTMGVFPLYAINTTPHDTDGRQGGAAGSIDVPENGILIGACMVRGYTGNFAWTGIANELFDVETSDNSFSSAAIEAGLSAETGRAYDDNFSGSIIRQVTAAISFAPAA
jgi:hypothetical protein